MGLKQNMPEYALSQKQMVVNVMFTALFALLTTLLLSPFSKTSWFTLSADVSGLCTLCFWVLCLLYISLSRAALYKRKRHKNISVLHYTLFCFAEALVISLLYMGLTTWWADNGWVTAYGAGSSAYLGSGLVFCIFGLGIPNLLSLLFFTINDRDQTIRLMNFGNVVSETPATPLTDKKIMLYDNSGVLKLILNQDSIYFIESDDNYIKVWFTDCSNEVKQYMLRCRLKTIEESFADSELVRCHRKYIVNIRKVEKVLREKDGSFILELDNPNIAPIPVSKTYEEGFISKFNSK